MEHGADTELGSHGSEVSGGQKKRIALARMYAGDAQLYVIDNVTSALFLIASNSPYALKMADQVVYLSEGGVKAMGRLEEVVAAAPEVGDLL